MIPVTKAYLPSRAKLDRYIDGIYERGWVTNKGALVRELTHRLENYLGVENLLLVANGTLALQVAYRALGITGRPVDEPNEVVTTPFSFVATASSLAWEQVTPVFADIDPASWCLDPSAAEAAITARTSAIVPVHVFGNACDVDAFDEIAQRRGLRIVYDGAHAFGVRVDERSVLLHGDATTLSFHATKLFHTIEGGAIVFRRAGDLARAEKLINFGITGPDRIEGLGINAKMNEFEAAMGLCILDEMDAILAARQEIWRQYEERLGAEFRLQARHPATSDNHGYFPIVMECEAHVERVIDALAERDVHPRRYFYPSLETVPYLGGEARRPHADSVARRVLCLPLYVGMSRDDVTMIADVVLRAVS